MSGTWGLCLLFTSQTKIWTWQWNLNGFIVAQHSIKNKTDKPLGAAGGCLKIGSVAAVSVCRLNIERQAEKC